jgi:hypothetical protein
MSVFGSKEVVTVAALVSRLALLAVADVLARSRMYAHQMRDLSEILYYQSP